MNKLSEFLQEDNGGFSATRLAFLLWAVGVLVVWIIESLSSKSLERIDPTVTTILGILMTGKVVQKFGEKPCDSGPEASTPPSAPKSGTPGQPNT